MTGRLYGKRTEAPAYEAGWKDTVVVNPAEPVRLIMQFKDYSDPPLPYMFHCHVLDHEDMGMMGQFVVVDDPAQQVKIESPITNGTMPEDPNNEHDMLLDPMGPMDGMK